MFFFPSLLSSHFFSLSFHVYECVLCMYMSVWVICLHMSRQRWEQTLGIFLCCSLPHALRHGLSLNQTFTVLARLTVQKAHSIYLSSFPYAWTQAREVMQGFYIFTWVTRIWTYVLRSSCLLNKYPSSLSHLLRYQCSHHHKVKEWMTQTITQKTKFNDPEN